MIPPRQVSWRQCFPLSWELSCAVDADFLRPSTFFPLSVASSCIAFSSQSWVWRHRSCSIYRSASAKLFDLWSRRGVHVRLRHRLMFAIGILRCYWIIHCCDVIEAIDCLLSDLAVSGLDCYYLSFWHQHQQSSLQALVATCLSLGLGVDSVALTYSETLTP